MSDAKFMVGETVRFQAPSLLRSHFPDGYTITRVLRWFTANIGVHHVHHLSSRIPFYRLPQVLRDHPAFGDIGRLTLRESLGCVRLVLWDEDRKRRISWREMRRLYAYAA